MYNISNGEQQVATIRQNNGSVTQTQNKGITTSSDLRQRHKFAQQFCKLFVEYQTEKRALISLVEKNRKIDKDLSDAVQEHDEMRHALEYILLVNQAQEAT
ncbi:hypothetical protein PCE1_001526 [Barthelona sp. PCE]